MQLPTLTLTLTLLLTATGVAQATEFKPTTIHLCGGIYAHQHNAEPWAVFGGRNEIMKSEPGSVSIKGLLAKYCPKKPHPEIHKEHL